MWRTLPLRIKTVMEKNRTARQRENSSCRELNVECLSQNAMIDAKGEAKVEASSDKKK